MAKCKQCGVEIKVVPGKVQKQFCSDAHRKAFKRAELRKSEATAAPSVDELRTTGTTLPTSDNSRQGITEEEFIEQVAEIFDVPTGLKRGKDIKCFADLPPHVQQTIDKMSMVDGKIDKDEKAKRTLAAIHYQHLFLDRYHSTGAVCTGVVTGKPGDADYNGICTPGLHGATVLGIDPTITADDQWRAERGR